MEDFNERQKKRKAAQSKALATKRLRLEDGIAAIHYDVAQPVDI